MNTKLSFAVSPCPNDTWVFAGIADGSVRITGFDVNVSHFDIETLNRAAIEGRFDVTKLSFAAWLRLHERYRLIGAGNALGYGCGPVLVSKHPVRPEELPSLRIVFPGENTTAHLLFRLYSPASKNRIFTTYDRVFDEIREGRADCGVVIHESRFFIDREGFYTVEDLGAWWEKTTGTPIPLGAIAVRSDLPESVDALAETAIRESMARSEADPASVMPFIRGMAQELDDTVIRKHIQTFVNGFTRDLGVEGIAAVQRLREMADAAGIYA